MSEAISHLHASSGNAPVAAGFVVAHDRDHTNAFGAIENAIAIASGKGGVGKTWFSITLSHALARLGKKMVLFDGDLGLANVDVQLGLLPRHDLNQVAQGQLMLKNIVSPYAEGGFDILAGQSGTGSLANISSQQLGDVRAQMADLASHYDHLVIDLGAGVERTVRQLASLASTILVVTNEEPTALTDAYAFIKVAQASGFARHCAIVVNQVTSKSDGERTYQTLRKACQSFLKIDPPLAGVIRRDTKVRDAIRAQSPLLTRSPSCDAASDVEMIAQRLLKGFR